MSIQHTFLVQVATGAQFNGAGTNYIVETPDGVIYVFYIDLNLDPAYKKSKDGGKTWSESVQISAQSATQLSIWYDRWSGLATDLVHVVFTTSATGTGTTAGDIAYRSLNVANNADTLSTLTIPFAGNSTAAGGALSVTRARGGNIYVLGCIDAGAESIFARSTDTGATWASRLTATEAATQDQWILVPGWAADTQDIMCFFWDASANEISRKLHDDSANTWAETSIATGMADLVATTAFPNFAAAVDLANSQNLLVAWSAIDTLNADLRCWKITESAITETTNVVLNSVDDQGLCAIAINSGSQDWYVYYSGKSDGSETWLTAVDVYYKISTDDGATWGSETRLTSASVHAQDSVLPVTGTDMRWLCTTPYYSKYKHIVSYYDNRPTSRELRITDDWPEYGGRITIS